MRKTTLIKSYAYFKGELQRAYEKKDEKLINYYTDEIQKLLRKIYYKILSSTTRMSYSSIAGTLGQHHATILHALNKFDWDYNHIPAFKEAYDRVYNAYTRNDTVVTIDTLTHENQILRETISKLKEELKQIRDVKASIKPRNQEATIYKSTV
jgi:hypothetical protein